MTEKTILFSKVLKSIRTERGISQAQLADRLYVTRSTINRWESGSRLPDNMIIDRRAAAGPMSGELAGKIVEILGPDGRHASDYSYYYNNIKDNAAKLIAAYMESQ